jgi:hypothetical protein
MPEPVRTYYRSRTPDGCIWCESRDPDEVRRMKHPVLPITLERMDVYEFTSGWQPWSLASIIEPDNDVSIGAIEDPRWHQTD